MKEEAMLKVDPGDELVETEIKVRVVPVMVEGNGVPFGKRKVYMVKGNFSIEGESNSSLEGPKFWSRRMAERVGLVYARAFEIILETLTAGLPMPPFEQIHKTAVAQTKGKTWPSRTRYGAFD